jgi:hypothetical protein
LPPNAQKCFGNQQICLKKTLRASGFIADSSPTDNKAGMRKECRKAPGGLNTLRKYPPRGIAWGKDSLYGAFIASIGNVPAGQRTWMR